MIVFADTSVIGRIYLDDQMDSAELRVIILDSDDPAVICRLTDVEFTHSVALAEHDKRLTPRQAKDLLDQYRDDTAEDGRVAVVEVTPMTFARAEDLARRFPTLRPLDAIQLAACAELIDAAEDEVALLTRDARQREVAKRLKIAVI
ncbi:MAG TPA: type II toxin-antitoxin system VapC family toxin [Jatrophihabitans sp.]